ncbi:MAG: dienelactone hydrolase family protein [Bradymonadaceae bacterium]
MGLLSWGCSFEPADLEFTKSCAKLNVRPFTVDLGRVSAADYGPFGAGMVSSGEIETEFERKFLITFPTCEDDEAPSSQVMPDGEWPVVVFSHAQNDRRHEIYDAYKLLHRHLASWGYVVLSIDNAEENRKKVEREGTSKENLQIRSDFQRAGIDLLESLNDESELFQGRLQLEQVIVAGHSRGGGASMLTARDDRRVGALIAFQSVDPETFRHGHVAVEVPALGFTAGLDDDIKFPRGEAIEDLFKARYAWVDILGGIHAYTTDDIPIRRKDAPEITRKEQHGLSFYFSTLFLLAEVRPEALSFVPVKPEALIYSHRASELADDLATPGVLTRWNSRHPDAILIDDFEFALVEESFLGSQSLRGDTYYWEGPGAARFAFTYGDYTSTMNFLTRSRSIALTAPEAEPSRLIVELVEPIVLGCEGRIKARVRAPASGYYGVESSLEVGIRGGSEERFVEMAAGLGPWGLGPAYGQLDLGLHEYGCVGEEMRLEEIHFRLANVDVMIDDLRVLPPPNP